MVLTRCDSRGPEGRVRVVGKTLKKAPMDLFAFRIGGGFWVVGVCENRKRVVAAVSVDRDGVEVPWLDAEVQP